MIVKYYVGYALLQAAFISSFTQFNQGQKKKSIITFACHFFVTFYMFTLLERTFHMVMNVFVTVFGVIMLIFYEAEWIGKWSWGS